MLSWREMMILYIKLWYSIFEWRNKSWKKRSEKSDQTETKYTLPCYVLLFVLSCCFDFGPKLSSMDCKKKVWIISLRFTVELLFNSNSNKSVKNSNEKRMSQLNQHQHHSLSSTLNLKQFHLMRPSGLIIAVIPFLPVSCTSSFCFPRWSNSQSKPHLLHQTVFCLKIVPLHSLSCNWFFLLK